MADANRSLIVWMPHSILLDQVILVAQRQAYSAHLVNGTEDFLRSLVEKSANVCILDTAIVPFPLHLLTAMLEAATENEKFGVIALLSSEEEAPPLTPGCQVRALVKPFALSELEGILSTLRDLPPANYAMEAKADPVGYWFGALARRILREQKQPHLALKIVSSLTTAKELEDLLARFLENIQNLVSAERAAVFLMNERKTELRAISGYGLSPHILKELRTPITPGGLISLAVTEPARGIISVKSAPLETAIAEFIPPTEFAVTIPLEQVFEAGADSLVSAPLEQASSRFAIVQTEPLSEPQGTYQKVLVRRSFGCLYLDNPYSVQPIHIEDKTVLEMMIRTSAMVINDILLTEGLNRRVTELAVLREASQKVSQTLDVDETLHAIIRAVTEGLRCERGSVMLLEKGQLVVRAYSGSRQESILGKTVKAGEGLAGWVLENRKPLLVKDLEKDPLFHRQSRPSYVTRSAIVAPLEMDGEMIGVINVSDKLDGTAFDESDLALLVSIAHHAVIALKNARLYTELKDSYLQTVRSLAQALDAKDPYTRGHSDRVAEYSVMIAEEMAQEAGISPEDLEMLRIAGILHDVGKIGVPESVLLKPGRLTEEEFKLIQKHAEQSDAIVRPIRFLDPVRGAVRSHHERYSGGGYPDNLVGEQIPLYARIMAVADAFDAMTTSRSYRKGMSVDEALKHLVEGAGSQFDPAVVETFKRLVEKGKIQHLVPKQD